MARNFDEPHWYDDSISDKQRELLNKMSNTLPHLNPIVLRNKGEASEFISKHYEEYNLALRQPKEKLCKCCKKEKAEFFDIGSNDNDKTLCWSCYLKKEETELKQLKEINLISKTTTKSEPVKEENSMLDKMKSLLGEFGKDTTGRFKVSFQGVAVRLNDSNYGVYDGESITNVMDFVIDIDNAIFKMPVQIAQIKKGDLIIANNRPLFVRAVSKKGIVALDPATSDEVTHIPTKNMFGLQFYTKVISLFELGNQQGAGGINPMFLLAMSEGKSGSKLESILPFMFMQQATGGTQANPMQQMLPMLMMSGEGKSSDMMGMMLMSQAFAGNGQGNPFANLFQPITTTNLEEGEE